MKKPRSEFHNMHLSSASQQRAQGGQVITFAESLSDVLRLAIAQPMLLISLAFNVCLGQGVSAAVTSLVNAERTFAAMSEQNGMKKAFLTFLADDGVIFRPGPVNGKQVWQKQEETTARLSWHPTVACVAASGDLGFTSGPWVYTPEAHLDQPPRYGHYVSVWKKRKDGEWRVAADIGITHDYSSVPDSLRVLSPSVLSLQKRSRLQERKSLFSAERRLSELASAEGLAAALARFLADDGSVYRDGQMPLVGRHHALEEKQGFDSRISFRVMFAALSRACDFAYTYGSYAVVAQKDTAGFFLRVWRKNESGEWKVVVDVSTKR